MHRLALTTALLFAAAAFAAPSPDQWAFSSLNKPIAGNALSVHSGSVYATGRWTIDLLDQNTGAKTGTIAAPPTAPFGGQVSFVSKTDRSFAVPCGANTTSGVAFYNAHGSMVWQTTFAQHTAAFPRLTKMDCSKDMARFSFVAGNVIGQCSDSNSQESANTTLFALSAETGEVRWAVALGHPYTAGFVPPVHAATGAVVVVTGQGWGNEALSVMAFNGRTGAVLWSLPPSSNINPMTPISICGDAAIVSNVGSLVAIDVATGKKSWANNLRAHAMLYVEPTCVPAVGSMASPEPTIVLIGNGAGMTTVDRFGVRSGRRIFSTILHPKVRIMMTLNVAVDIQNDRVLALLSTPNPRPGLPGSANDILTVSSVRLSNGAHSRVTQVPDVIFPTVTAQIAARPSLTSNATRLYFATGFLSPGPFRPNPVVYCRPFE